jgi:hypothetical protein
MGVACANLTWATMGKIQEDWGLILLHAFSFCIRKIYIYHILYVMFEMLAKSHTCLLERLPNFVLVNEPCANLPHLTIIFVTTICYFNFLLDAIFFLASICKLPTALIKSVK